MRVLKIECLECHEQALIRRNNRKHPHLYDIYCSCRNMACGHRFVMNLTFSHTLCPGAKSGGTLMKTVLDGLTLSQRENLLTLLQRNQNANFAFAKQENINNAPYIE